MIKNLIKNDFVSCLLFLIVFSALVYGCGDNNNNNQCNDNSCNLKCIDEENKVGGYCTDDGECKCIDGGDGDSDSDADGDTNIDTENDEQNDIAVDVGIDNESDTNTENDIAVDTESDVNIDINECIDNDGDNYGINCSAGEDCDDTSNLCNVDCSDTDNDNISDCRDDCVDVDGDGYGNSCTGQDCDDTDINNWINCDTCVDSDGDNYFVECDSYQTINGPDCDDTSNLCNVDCSDTNNNSIYDCKEETWILTIGGSSNDYATSAIETSDNGFLAAGYTNSFGDGDDDMWVIKLNSSGSIIWQKTIGGSNNDGAYTVIETSDNGFLVAGYTYSYGAGSGDMWIIKLNSSGSIVWQKTIGGSGNDYAISVIETSDNGFLVVGGNGDILLIKLDNSGNIIWQKTIGGADYDWVNTVIETSNNGFLVAGSTSSYGAGNYDIWVIKLNSDGSIVWQKTIGGSDMDYAKSAIETSDNGFIVVGATASYGAGNYDMWIIKLNSFGNIVWQKTIGESEMDWAISVIETSDNGFFVAGHIDNARDMWVIKLNSSGNIVWQRIINGGFSNDDASSVIETSDNRFVVAGYTNSYSYGYEMWLIKLNSDGEILDSCNLIQDSAVTPQDTTVTPQDSTVTSQDSTFTPHDTAVTSQDSDAVTEFLCQQ